MNIQLQICGLVILLLLFIFYKSHKTLQLYKEKFFYRAMFISIVLLTLDIYSLIAINFQDSLPKILVDFVCKSYIVLLIWSVRSALIYVLTDLLSVEKHKKCSRVLFLITTLQSIITYFLPIYIFHEGRRMYTYGPSTIWVYICSAVNILSTLGIAIFFYKRMNPRRAFAVIIWMVTWSFCAILQFLNSELLVVGFASALGILILFVVMENPEANLDRGMGCFNSYAMTEYIAQKMEHKQKFSLLEISFEHADILEESDLNIDAMLRGILRILKPYKKILVFKKRSIGFALISESGACLEEVGHKIESYLSEFKSLHTHSMLILIENANSFRDADDLSQFLFFARSECANQRGMLIPIDETIVSKYREKHLIEKEIREALEEDRVEVFLQPIFSNRKGYFTSAEALVRIRKQSGDFLSPGVFIPVAEENGQILEVGERVFEKVCDFLKNTKCVQYGLEYIEVNLSIIQCEQENLSERLIRIVEKYEVDANRINLEITETASISARTTLLRNMEKLMEYGFTFSLDDFGKGESNLMYVVEMPVSIVKLDYDMSKAFFSSPRAEHVVRAVVKMAHDMKLKLVAEGIETKEEIDAMYQEDIDYIQGYYYSKPIPMVEAIHFFEEHNRGMGY